MPIKLPCPRTRRRATRATALTVVAVIALGGCTSSRHGAASTDAGSPGTATASKATRAASPSAHAPFSTTGPGPTVIATTLPTRLPEPLSRVVAVDLGGTVVIIGGLTGRQQTTAAIELFDPPAGTMTAGGRLPAPVHDAAAGVITGRAFVAGGGAASTTDAVQQVHADGTAVRAGRLPQPRSDDSVAVSGTTLYVVGGYDGSHELPGVLATTDGVTFTQIGRLGETVRYGAAYAAGHSVWMFGGEHHGVATADIQRVDATTGRSSVIAKLPHPLAHEAVAALGDQVLIIGGTDGHTLQGSIYAFDPMTNTVAVVGSLPEAVANMAIVVAGSTAYVIGGDVLTPEQTVSATNAIVAVRMETVSPTASGHGRGTNALPRVSVGSSPAGSHR